MTDETDPVVDLVHARGPGGDTLTALVTHDHAGPPVRLGPVPSAGALEPLGALLAAELPGRFASGQEAATYLGIVHTFNTMRGVNFSGQPYPLDPPEADSFAGGCDGQE